MAPVPILLIEDSPADADLIGETLASGAGNHYRVQRATTLAEGVEVATKQTFGAVLLDLNLPDSRALATLRAWLDEAGARPVIVLTGEGIEATGPKAIQEGAQDYLPKDELGPTLVTRVIEQARERWALESEQQLLATAFRNGQATLIADPQGTIQRINPAFTAITGYTHGEMVGRTFPLFETAWADDGFQQALLHSLPTHGEWQGEIQQQHKQAGPFPAQITITAVRDAAGGIVQLIIALQDITEKKREEESRRQLVEILETTLDLVVVFDPQGSLIYANHAWVDQLPLEPSDIAADRPIDHLLTSETAHQLHRTALPAAAQDGYWEGTAKLCAQSGEELTASMVLLAHFDEAPHPVRYSALLRPDADNRPSNRQSSVPREQREQAARTGAERLHRAVTSAKVHRIPVDSQGDTVLLAPEEIRFFQAEGNYALAFMAQGHYLANLALGELEARLASAGFLRTHRSYLVNLSHVNRLRTMDGQTYLIMDTEHADRVPVSRRSLETVREAFGII